MQALAEGLAHALSGASLPLLHAAAEAEGPAVALCALAGWVCGVCVGWGWHGLPSRVGGTLARALGAVDALVQVCFGSALLFRQSARWDHRIGPGLCAIPLFHALCVPAPASGRYDRELSACLGAAAALALVLSAVPALSDDDARVPALDPAEGVDYFLIVANGALAGADTDGAGGLPAALVCGGALAALSLWPAPLRALLRRHQSAALLVAAGVVTVLAARRQAVRARRHLELMARPAGGGERWFRQPQRALMLAVAVALAVGHALQWRDWRGPAWAGAAMLAARGVARMWG